MQTFLIQSHFWYITIESQFHSTIFLIPISTLKPYTNDWIHFKTFSKIFKPFINHFKLHFQIHNLNHALSNSTQRLQSKCNLKHPWVKIPSSDAKAFIQPLFTSIEVRWRFLVPCCCLKIRSATSEFTLGIRGAGIFERGASKLQSCSLEVLHIGSVNSISSGTVGWSSLKRN